MTVTAECSVMSQVFSASILVKLQNVNIVRIILPPKIPKITYFSKLKVARKFDFKRIAVKNLHVQHTP